MLIFPAIDILDQKCVRLSRGEYDSSKTYSESPQSIAKAFYDAGAKYIHTVDLNAAKSGEITNLPSIKALIDAVPIPVQVGGGIRSAEAAARYLDIGASRVILGTAAVKNMDLLIELCEKYPNRICVSLDVSGEQIMLSGWTEGSRVSIFDYLKRIDELNIAAIIATDISRDGMLSGPGFALYEKMRNITAHNIIASGGISSIADIERLREMNLYGAIVGKAIYENKISLNELLREEQC